MLSTVEPMTHIKNIMWNSEFPIFRWRRSPTSRRGATNSRRCPVGKGHSFNNGGRHRQRWATNWRRCPTAGRGGLGQVPLAVNSGTASSRRRSPVGEEGFRGWRESGLQVIRERVALEPLVKIGKVLAEFG